MTVVVIPTVPQRSIEVLKYLSLKPFNLVLIYTNSLYEHLGNLLMVAEAGIEPAT